jgi:hypothetical protein
MGVDRSCADVGDGRAVKPWYLARGEPSCFAQRRGEPLADGEVYAQSPMKWALDAFGEPCEAVNLRQQNSGKCGCALAR